MGKRCPCAPGIMHCEYEEFDCMKCAGERIRLEVREIIRAVPIIGKMWPLYQCEMFEPKEGEQ